MMKNTLDYKGYFTNVEYSAEDKVLHGKIEGIDDLVTFESESAENIESEFQNAVDDYIEYCKKVGKEPEKRIKPRKTGSAYRRLMKKQKKDRLMKIITSDGYNPTAGYIDDWDFVDGKWKPVGKYIKYPRNSNKQRFFKRYSNRVVRKKELPIKGNGYRKHFDYWWALY